MNFEEEQGKSDIKMNPYNHSKIYKLVDNSEYYYIGSCSTTLARRYYIHKQNSKKKPELKVFKVFTHEKFINNEIKIILIEELNLENRDQLRREEDKYIRNSLKDPFCLNSIHAVLNLEQMKQHKLEYAETHKKESAEQHKIYYESHKNEILQNAKEYRSNNLDKIKAYKRDYYQQNADKIKSKTRAYYEEHKEIVSARVNKYKKENEDFYKEYFKNRYYDNIEKFKEQQKRRELCECGEYIRICKKTRHIQSNKHQNWLNGKIKCEYYCGCGSGIRIKERERHEKSKKHQTWLKLQSTEQQAE